jgi:hypothetical protein
MLKQLYYSLIYPYINYGLMSWGNTYTSKLTKLCSSQNKCIRSIFFTRKENVTPYYNLLGILKLDNVFQLKIATFVYEILAETNDVPTVFASSIEVVSAQHSHNTRFASGQNLSRPKHKLIMEYTHFNLFHHKFGSLLILKSNDQIQCQYLKKYILNS